MSTRLYLLVLNIEVTGARIKASDGGCVKEEIVTCNTEYWTFQCLIPGLSHQILISNYFLGPA